MRGRGIERSELLLLRDRDEEIKQESIEKNRQAINRQIGENPNDYKVRVEKGDLLEREGKHEKALLAYDRALDLLDSKEQEQKEDYEIWWKKAVAFVNSGNLSEANECYERALVLKPAALDEYIIAREYAHNLEEVDDAKKSIALYKKSLWLEPRYRAAKYERRKIYKKLYSKQ